jgi:hypothetical protein
LFVNITGNWKNRLAHTRQIIIADWLSLSESSWRVFITRRVPAIVPIEGAVLFELGHRGTNLNNTAPSIGTIAGWGLKRS